MSQANVRNGFVVKLRRGIKGGEFSVSAVVGFHEPAVRWSSLRNSLAIVPSPGKLGPSESRVDKGQLKIGSKP